MSALTSYLGRLLQQLDSFELQPSSREVRIVEISQISRVSEDGTYHVQRNELRNPWTTKVGSMNCWRQATPGLLSVNDTDLRVQPYEIRYVHLTQHFRGVSDVLRVSETAMTTKAKRDFVKKMHSANAEGFVQEPKRHVRGRTSGTAFQMQVRCHHILHRWPQTREESE